ncbi:ABC transporter substrate-binding protein [Brenneria corticis]|uniref:ABC transporter substrate-binding protein n=1 Tax=Brenneria corticis TaxID=2173106 RepID=A0A2U1UDK9_9GAMM|nr:extracellular solute-binding protein [Brenneria sp. CFCC 11842]PWC19759.1 hypothetical protein DDT56_00655 [Brenneria sp. CFCC 11842]
MTINWKKGAAALLAAGTLLAGTPALGAETLESLYAQAKEKKVISFGGTLREADIKVILESFEAEYPGLKVNYLRRATGPLIQLMEAERRANKTSFDLVNLSEPDAFLRWREQGYVAKVDVPETADLLPETFDPQGYSFAIGVTPMPGIYNTQKLSPEQAPTSLKQLTDARWKGTIAISRPTRGGTNAASLMNVVLANGPDFIARYAPGLEILLTNGNEAAINAIISGERLISWGSTGYRAIGAINDGAPIKLIWWEEGVALAHYPTGVLSQAKNPAGAKLLLRWLLSEKAQKLIVAHLNVHSSRKTITETPPGLPALSSIPVKYFGAERISVEGGKYVGEFERALGLQ